MCGAGRRTTRRVWLLVGLLSAAHLLAFVDKFAISAVADHLKSAFHLSETELGALLGLAISLPYAAAILPLGRLADRIPPQRLILAGLVVWTTGAVACAFSTSLVQLWGARMLIGVGEAAFLPGSLAVIGAAFKGPAAARPLSVFTAGSTLGKSVALLASGLILSRASGLPYAHSLFGDAPWREVFAFTAAPNLLLIAAFAVVRPPVPTPIEARADAARGAGSGDRILTPAFVTFALVALAPIVLIQAAAAWTPVFYSRQFHLPASRAAFLIGSIVLVAAPLGHLVGGQLTALAVRRGVEPGRLIATCLAGAPPLGAAFCLAPNLAFSLAAYGLVVVLLSIAAPAGLFGVGRLAPPRRVSAANAIYMSFVTLVGVGLGPTVVGAMSDALFGGRLGYSLFILFVGVPLACAALTLTCGGLWRPGAPGSAIPISPCSRRFVTAWWRR
jgi:MFS family permease